MFKQKQQQTKRDVVDIDTRRRVYMQAKARKPGDVALVNHETFIRNTLKDVMGWPRREPAPDSIKQAAREMAAALVACDRAVSLSKQLADIARSKASELITS